MNEEARKELKRFENKLDALIKKELPTILTRDINHYFQDISVAAYLILVLEEET